MKSVFKHRQHIFYNQISTDGYSASILFIDRKFKNKKFGEKIKEVDNSEEEDNYIPVESLSKEQCEELLNGNYKFIGQDPGLNKSISMIDGFGKYYSYSAGRRRFETYTKRSAEILYQEKKKHNIFEIETAFSKIATSRTMNYEKYTNFIKEKFIVINKLKSFYQNILWRKLDFRRHIRTKQSEINLLNEIENCFLTQQEKDKGKQLVIMNGDYTSQLYHKTHTKLENVVIKNKHKKSKHLHQVLTLTISELRSADDTKSKIKNDSLLKCKIFVNRDKNTKNDQKHFADQRLFHLLME